MIKFSPLFKSHGFVFKLLKRSGRIALLEKSKPHSRMPTYEVVVIQESAGRVIAGRVLSASEHTPSSAKWGTLGWTFTTLETAQQRYHELLERPALCPPKPRKGTLSAGEGEAADRASKSRWREIALSMN